MVTTTAEKVNKPIHLMFVCVLCASECESYKGENTGRRVEMVKTHTAMFSKKLWPKCDRMASRERELSRAELSWPPIAPRASKTVSVYECEQNAKKSITENENLF